MARPDGEGPIPPLDTPKEHEAEVSPAGEQPVLESPLDAMMRELRRPFTPEAVRFKVQVNPKSDDGSAICVAYIDARLVSERLNAVAPGRWSHTFVNPPNPSQKSVACRIKLEVDGQVLTREDVGWASGGDTSKDQGYKGMYSDAFKRAAVHYGIGTTMYAFPQQFIKARDLKKTNDGKYRMTDKVETQLRNAYRTWVTSEAVAKIFGAPLSHGDVEGSAGDLDVDAPFSEVLEFGVGASDEQLKQATNALLYLFESDSEAANKTLMQVEEKFGYIPAAATRAIGMVIAARKSLDEGKSEDTTNNNDKE